MRWLPIIVVLASCGEDHAGVSPPIPATTTPPSEAAAPAAPRPLPAKLVVTLDGAPLMFKSVYARSALYLPPSIGADGGTLVLGGTF